MATRNPEKNGQNSLPFAALKLLAPPVRLVSAALWKVMKERDVLQYGIVEEFVTSACDTVPGLLTLRHQAKLTLGFRARFILELCLKEPDPKTIAVHMKRIQVNVSPSSSVVNMKRDLKIQEAVENFHGLVQELLTDKTKRDTFYKEQFPVEFGPKYDQELEKLLWEFLIRLDTLLPVPNLAQTVSWLSEAPPVLEECARAATQPQLLKVLLQHQSCIGHLETAAALPPNMGDSILASLSLLPSGKQPSNEATEFGPTDDTENKENTPNHPSSQGSSSQHKSVEQQNLTGENEDYVADSEDEGTKNFKGRLFAKRYCKTKHGTYVPTLREYWKPRAERRTLFVPHCKQR
uniref:TERF1-interacting nuclear factor 2 N-terminal domain-containing protein n=1 Tax=Knipowitschia caucasica TaxID=637954 RepID=A0AAV2KRL9_KNICA